MKKEIGVLTFHKAVSYGAAYQTYALQTYLNGIGYDVKIVDYIPPRFTTFNSIFSMPANGNKVKKIIKFIPYVLSKATSVYMLQRFNKKYLTLTDSYCTEQELIDSDLRFDTFITGSDQVWNLEFDKFENIRPYLLSFTKQKLTNTAFPLTAEATLQKPTGRCGQPYLQTTKNTPMRLSPPLLKC